MRKFYLLLIVVFLLMSFMAKFAFAQEELSVWDSKKRVERLQEELDLTEEQSKQIMNDWQAKEEKAVDLRNKLKDKGEELRLLVDGTEEVNEEEGFKIIDEMGMIKTELYKLNFTFLLNLKKTLSPEQWERLKEINQQKEKRRAPRMKEHPKRDDKVKRNYREKD